MHDQSTRRPCQVTEMDSGYANAASSCKMQNRALWETQPEYKIYITSNCPNSRREILRSHYGQADTLQTYSITSKKN